MPIAGEVVTFSPKGVGFLRLRDRYIAEASRVASPVVVGSDRALWPCEVRFLTGNRTHQQRDTPIITPINPRNPGLLLV
jgi:hypothetical protein